MTETVEKTRNGAILYDRSIINQISPAQFTPAGWRHADPVAGSLRSAGRGNTQYVGNVPKQFVLRHYLRGGMASRLMRDRYLFSGEDKTRSFREWRLLDKLATNKLNVPRPAAARYRRFGPYYTADIITVRIPGVVSLCDYLLEAPRDEAFWRSVGTAVWRFHEAGVFHADLNAYNVQIDADSDVWLLDFDRGELRSAGTWQQETLRRLHRSLQKIVGLDPAINFAEKDWEALLAGYFAASRSA